MSNIVPAVLEKTYGKIKWRVSQVVNTVPLVQLDICDGRYVDTKTYPYSDDFNLENLERETEGMPFWQEIDYELDLMVLNPFEEMEKFLAMSPSRIIFHLKSVKDNLDEFIKFKDEYSNYISIGLAIEQDDNTGEAHEFIAEANFVQCMGIARVGRQGQAFDKKVFELIKEIKSKFPEKEIQVDGGVNTSNISELENAGVSNLIVGSAIFKSENPKLAIEELK